LPKDAGRFEVAVGETLLESDGFCAVILQYPVGVMMHRIAE
jgi:hypothetical protein